MIRLIIASVVLALLAYLLLWPVAVAPVAWEAPPDRGYQGAFSVNDRLSSVELLDIAGTHGPEALALGADGLIYSSSHEGWIIRFDPATATTERWVNTGGRPLGLTFDAGGNLLVADAFLGLLAVSPSGVIRVLADSVNGEPIRYADDVDVAPDGRVYFSDASSKFGASDSGGTYEASLLDLMEHGGHGRLLVYDPRSDEASVLLDQLDFANGVAVSQDGRFVLVNETGHYRIVKVWLEAQRWGEHEILIENLPGFPDNVVRDPQGHFWVGLVSPRSQVLDKLADKPALRRVIERLPAVMKPAAEHYSHVFAINEQGEVLVSLQDPAGGYHTNTGALEHDGWLYISSLHEDRLARLPWPQAGD